MAGLNLPFVIDKIDWEEKWPEDLKAGEIAEYLAKKKSQAYSENLSGRILLTCDTIVWHNERVLNKPVDLDEARWMLSQLSGSVHDVYTGVCLRDETKSQIFSEKTSVSFREISTTSIEYYVNLYSPLDKAGAYGIQEWIGYTHITGIQGCYYNVMGLPLQALYKNLMSFTGESKN